MLTDLRVDELKIILRMYGLNLSGRKKDMIQRIALTFQDKHIGQRIRKSVFEHWSSRADRLGMIGTPIAYVRERRFCKLV